MTAWPCGLLDRLTRRGAELTLPAIAAICLSLCVRSAAKSSRTSSMAEPPRPKVAKNRSTSGVSSRIPSAAIPHTNSALSTSPASSHASKTVITRSHCGLSSSRSRLFLFMWSMPGPSCFAAARRTGSRRDFLTTFAFVSPAPKKLAQRVSGVRVSWCVKCPQPAGRDRPAEPQNPRKPSAPSKSYHPGAVSRAWSSSMVRACSHSAALPCLHALTPSSWLAGQGGA